MAAVSESDQALQGLLGTSNLSLLGKPMLKPTYQTWYPLIVGGYALLVLCGALLNTALLGFILLRRLHRQPTMCLLANLAVAHLVQCLAGLPITLAIMLLRNWVFGAFLCYFVPMLQDIPVHVSVITFVTIAYDRYRFLEDPSKQRLPALVIAIGSWLTASCIVVPYPIYVTYLDFSLKDTDERLEHEAELSAVLAPQQNDPGKFEFCYVNLGGDIMDYHRCIFALMYVVPAITLGYLYAQTERLLSHKERPVTLVLYDTQRSARSSSAASVHGYRRSLPARSLLYHSSTLDGTGLDLVKEQRTQKYLVGMTMAFFVLFTPLNLLRTNIWKMGETYDNEYYIDIGYAVFVWLGYLPTCSMPLLVASWMLSRSEKERVRGYFRFSNRRFTRSGHHRSARSGSDSGLPPNGASSAADGTALSTPGPSPPHGALAAHGTRTASVVTASTAITTVSPPSSPRPTPRPSPRPPRGESLVPAAAAPLSEVNLLKHDLQRSASHRLARVHAPAPSSPSTLSSTSSSRNTNSSSSYGPVHNPFLTPSVLAAALPPGDAHLSDTTPSSPPITAVPGLPQEAPLSRMPSYRSQHHRGSSRRRKQPDLPGAPQRTLPALPPGLPSGLSQGPPPAAQLDKGKGDAMDLGMERMELAPQNFHQAVHQGLHKPQQPPRYFTFDHVDRSAGHGYYQRP